MQFRLKRTRRGSSMTDMNPSEGLQAEIVIGSAASLTAMYFGGRVLLDGLRLWRSSSRQDRNNVSSARLARSSEPPICTGSLQVSPRDQRLTIKLFSNQGVQHSGTRHRRRK